MYIQIKKSGKNKYIYIIEAYRKPNGKVGHRTIERLGKYEDHIKRDPDFLEKLKENLKIRAIFLKKGSKLFENISNKDAYSPNSALSRKGYPIYNYANIVLKQIFKHVLYLDYCFKYLQSQYDKKLSFDVATIIFNRILTKLFFKNICHVDNSYYFLNNAFTLESIYDNKEELNEFIEKQQTKVLNFLIKKLTNQLNIKLPENFFIQLDKDDIKFLEDKVDNSLSLKEFIENKKTYDADTFLNLFESLIIKVMLLCIRQRVNSNIFNTDKDIINILNDCSVSLFIPQSSDEKIMYLKVSNNNVSYCDALLEAFELSPLLNCSLKSDLSRALKIKYCHDKQILGETIYNRFTIKTKNDS